MVGSVLEGDWKLIDREGAFVFRLSISKICALADVYRQKLGLDGNERIKSWEFIL